MIANGSTPKSGGAEFWDGDIFWITPADFSRASSGYLNESGRTITDAGLASCGTRLVPSNSIVISVRAPIGEVIQAASELCTNQGCKSLIKDTSELHERFFFHVFSCSSKQLNALGLGTTFMELSTHGLAQYRIPLPPYQEQEKIALFLDHKTAQIDRLIEKKQELIGKLQEQRITIITQAVTKGLDENVVMKAAPGAWFAETPRHWEVRPLKFCLEFLNQRRIPLSAEERTYMGGNFPYYGASGIIDHIDSYIFSEPTILIAEDGANLLSRTTPLAFEARGKYWVNNHAHILKPIDGSYTYWANLLCTIDFSPWITGAAQPKLTKDNLGAIPVPCPPILEQEQIANYINSRVNRTDPMIDANRKAIDSLQEYRTALITAAVTGQIDVRDWQCPEPTKEPADKEVA